MKKIVIALTLVCLAAAPASAQSVLSKLKEKASEAMGNVTSGALSERLGGALGGMLPGGQATQNSDSDDSNGISLGSGEQMLPSRRASSFGWDGPVTPSAAKFPVPLMNEFPPVPSAAELANPTEENQIAYYKAIKAVTLRAEELNADTTCEDEEAIMWRKKSNQMLKDMFGLTDEEIAMLDRDDLSEAEQQRIQDKISKAMLGDMDVNSIENMASGYEGKSEDEIVAMMGERNAAALDEVYDRNAADIRKYMGVSPAELKAATRAQMKSGNSTCPEMNALNQKVQAYQKQQAAVNPSFKKEASAFENKMRAETMQANKQASGLSSMGNMMGQMAKMQEKASAITALEQKMSAYLTKSQQLIAVPDEGADAQFSAADRKKVLALKDQIYATDDPSVYNPLYLQALQIIRSYRERAAAVWAADVQKRFNQMKANMTELIKLNRQAVADELIPECALWRAPLNAVIVAGDLLEEAYSEFPSNYPPMYKEEIIREVSLSKVPGGSGTAWFPEFSVFGASHFDGIAAGKYIFASNENGEVFQFSSGVWTKLTPERIKELSEMKRDVTPADQTFTSRDGKRKVVFNANGGFLLLPEGDEIFQPHAWKAYSDKIQWVNANTTEDGKYQLILCTYKF